MVQVLWCLLKVLNRWLEHLGRMLNSVNSKYNIKMTKTYLKSFGDISYDSDYITRSRSTFT